MAGTRPSNYNKTYNVVGVWVIRMVDWETTKIKKDVKDRAKDDPRTYTEIMEAGLSDDDWDGDRNRDVDVEALAEQLQAHIDYPEQQDTAAIVQHLEDLETRLPAKVAQELQR